jgi:hypothetical protein
MAHIQAGPSTSTKALLCVHAGWSFKKSGLDVRIEGNVTVYGIPYSEHSSFEELRACVKALRPRRLIPTVNASTPAAARALVDRRAAPLQPGLLCMWHPTAKPVHCGVAMTLGACVVAVMCFFCFPSRSISLSAVGFLDGHAHTQNCKTSCVCSSPSLSLW